MMPGALTRMADASLVAPGLFVGSRPTPGRYRWLHVLVLCAKEYQPSSSSFPGLTVLHVPLDDNPLVMHREEVALAISAARTVARYLGAGRTVLASCHQGWNRSGLIAALAMREAFDMDADEAVARVRSARGPAALSNPLFEQLIYRYRRGRR
jgi:protein-tyrosine phosphatase